MSTTGIIAERKARWYLRRRGWRVVAHNWIGGGGELDIVASRWRTLLVVEVRYRRAGDGVQSVDRAKLQRTVSAARRLIQSHSLERYRLRIDILALDKRGHWNHQRDVLAAQPGS